LPSNQKLELLSLPVRLKSHLKMSSVTTRTLTANHNVAHVMEVTIAARAHAPEEVEVAVETVEVVMPLLLLTPLILLEQRLLLKVLKKLPRRLVNKFNMLLMQLLPEKDKIKLKLLLQDSEIK